MWRREREIRRAAALLLASALACAAADSIAVEPGRYFAGLIRVANAAKAKKQGVQLATRACYDPGWVIHAPVSPLQERGSGRYLWRLGLPGGSRWVCQDGVTVIGLLVDARKPLPAGPVGERNLLHFARGMPGPRSIPLRDLGLAYAKPPPRIRIGTVAGKAFHKDSLYSVGLKEYLAGEYEGGEGVVQILVQPVEGNLKWIMHSSFIGSEAWSGYGYFGREGMDKEVEFYCFAVLMRRWIDPEIMGRNRGIPPPVWAELEDRFVLAKSEPARVIRVDPVGPKLSLEIHITRVDGQPLRWEAPVSAADPILAANRRGTDLEVCHLAKVEGMVTGGSLGPTDRLWLLAWKSSGKIWTCLGEAARRDRTHFDFQYLHLGAPGDTLHAFVAVSKRKPQDIEKDQALITFTSARLRLRLTSACEGGG